MTAMTATTTTKTTPATIVAAEAALVSQINAATTLVESVGGISLDEAIFRFRVGVSNAMSRLASARDEVSGMMSDLVSQIDSFAQDLSIDLTCVESEKVTAPEPTIPGPAVEPLPTTPPTLAVHVERDDEEDDAHTGEQIVTVAANGPVTPIDPPTREETPKPTTNVEPTADGAPFARSTTAKRKGKRDKAKPGGDTAQEGER